MKEVLKHDKAYRTCLKTFFFFCVILAYEDKKDKCSEDAKGGEGGKLKNYDDKPEATEQ